MIDHGYGYEIVTCDWKPAQTALWRYWVEKHCPSARIVTVPDSKPIPWCWSSGKLNCFLAVKGPRIIYLDTDTIITHDLAEVFNEEHIGNARIGLSTRIELYKFHERKKDQINRMKQYMDYRIPPRAVSSGMLVLNEFDPYDLYIGWKSMMEFPPFRKTFPNHQLLDEFALSLFVSSTLEREDSFWSIPLEIHGNIVGAKTYFGASKQPWVIHYHKKHRLKTAKLEHFLKTD